jgi:hypothetical protein
MGKKKRIFACGMALIFCWISITPAKTIEHSETGLSKGETVYIPVYSHIYSGNREKPFYLAATLSIRNTDLKYSITLVGIDYYDTKGKLLKSYIDKPVIIPPLGTERYIIKESDKAGGSGANFIVHWKSDHNVNHPLMESIMIGTKNQQGLSFTSRGRTVVEHE